MNGGHRPLRDLGTPPPKGETATVSLQIDGQQIQVAEGTSVLRAAASHGIKVPTLCATDSLDAFGSCRMCLVEIEGRRGTPASCTTPAEDGMVVNTQSGKLEKIRKNVLELYISDHPLECVSCPTNGDCELQDVAAELGVEE
jgi:formate dehydrogenase major subunit